MIAIVLQNGSELKSVEVNNLKFKVTLDLFASKEEGKSDKTAYTQDIFNRKWKIQATFDSIAYASLFRNQTTV